MASRTAPRRGAAPAVWTGVLVVALLASTAVLGRPTTYPQDGAAAWLPPDGTRQRYASATGTFASEWALDQAPPLLGSGPTAFYSWLGQTGVDWQTAALARLSTVFESPSGEPLGREDDLYSVAPDGLRAEAEVVSDGTTRIYLPGRLDVPGALAAGATWTSSGVVVETTPAGEQRLDYRSDYSALRPADTSLIPRGCVVVAMRHAVGDRPVVDSEVTWCRGAGIASFQGPAGRWAPATPAAPPVPTDDPGFDWARAEQLTFTPRTVNQVGAANVLLSPLSAPGVLPDGRLVFNNHVTSHDVLALDTAVDPPPAAWRGRPGGRTTATATFGGVTVAAGTGRRLVAYGPAGQWLWDQPLGDLAVVTPARLGGLVVVPTLDGQVTAFDLATGEKRWSYTASAEVRVAPVVTGDRVLVADQAGQLSCLDATGAELWTADTGLVEHLGVWAGTGGRPSVVVVPEGGGSHVRGLSLADGSRLWRVREDADADDVVALGDVMALRDDAQTLALDPLTGARRWRWAGARTYAGTGGGGRLLMLTAAGLVLLHDDGGVVKEWPLSVGDPTRSTSYLVASQQRVVVYGAAGLQVGVLP